jgi:hypothetical protein
VLRTCIQPISYPHHPHLASTLCYTSTPASPQPTPQPLSPSSHGNDSRPTHSPCTSSLPAKPPNELHPVLLTCCVVPLSPLPPIQQNSVLALGRAGAVHTRPATCTPTSPTSTQTQVRPSRKPSFRSRNPLQHTARLHSLYQLRTIVASRCGKGRTSEEHGAVRVHMHLHLRCVGC